jgi:predicted nucleic acid-binding protein
VLAGLYMLEIDATVRRRAADLRPLALGSLDALHLASALSLEGELGTFVAYDQRLLVAARSAGLPTLAPGS